MGGRFLLCLKPKNQVLLPQNIRNSSSFLQLIKESEQIRFNNLTAKAFFSGILNSIPPTQIKQSKRRGGQRKPTSTNKTDLPSNLHEFVTVCTFPSNERNKTREPHASHCPHKKAPISKAEGDTDTSTGFTLVVFSKSSQHN